MIALRAALAAAMLACGVVILVRLILLGLHPQLLPGAVLAAAMIALGAHRLSLVVRATRAGR